MNLLFAAEALEADDDLDGGERAAELAMLRALRKADQELHAEQWRMVSATINRLRVYGGGYVYNAQIVVEIL
jgi:hypothetical protein